MSSNLDTARAILGHTARALDAVVRQGHKDLSRRGAPVDRDAWEIAKPEAVWGEAGGRKVRHRPALDCRYNKRPKGDRRTIRGRLVGLVDDLVDVRRRHRDPPQGETAPPDRQVWCSTIRGDHTRARRWARGDWQDIECPGEGCRFAGTCRVRTTVQIVIDEPDAPGLSASVGTGGWASSRGMVGALRSLVDAGVDVARGVPVTLALEPRSKGNRRWYDVVTRVDLAAAMASAPSADEAGPAEPDPEPPAAPEPAPLDLEALVGAMERHGWPRDAVVSALPDAPTRADGIALYRRAESGERPPTPPADPAHDDDLGF